jgi:hypothetical protein
MREGFEGKAITATTQITTGGGVVGGIFVSSNTSGTVTVRDSADGTGDPIIATYSLPAANGFISFGNLAFGYGLHVTVGGTASITVLYRRGA